MSDEKYQFNSTEIKFVFWNTNQLKLVFSSKTFCKSRVQVLEMLYKATRCDDTDLLKKFSEVHLRPPWGKMVCQ